MKNEENIKNDWCDKIKKNNLEIINYFSYRKVECKCIKCGVLKIDNCRNLAYKDYKCKYCVLSEESFLIKEGKVSLLKIQGTKIFLKCKNNHEYTQYRGNLLQGKKCEQCYLENKAITKNVLIKRINEIHGDMYKYDLSNFKNLHSKIEIKCSKNHTFIQKASNHLQGKGCPICRESLGERTISNILNKYKINYVRQKTFPDCIRINLLKFDFYLPELNYIIEYDGVQHFESVKIFGGDKKFEESKIKDTIKNNYCKDNGINLLRISHKENIIDKMNLLL